MWARLIASFSFNTQPPEGGWRGGGVWAIVWVCFNTQPPEGGWRISVDCGGGDFKVSTHSRPKAAGK